MSFSANLNRMMKDRNWEMAHLAAALADQGHSVATITVERWCRGRIPKGVYLPAIAKALGCSIDDLFSDCATGAAAANQ